MGESKFSRDEILEIANEIARQLTSKMMSFMSGYTCPERVTFTCSKTYDCIAPHKCQSNYNGPSKVSEVSNIIECGDFTYHCDASSFRCNTSEFKCNQTFICDNAFAGYRLINE